MRWLWPWHRTRPITVNGDVAAQEKRQAEKRLAQQKNRWPEVVVASDQFAAIVERALRRSP